MAIVSISVCRQGSGAATRDVAMAMNRFGVKHKSWKEPKMRLQLTCTGGFLGGKQEPVDAAQHPITRSTFVKMTKSSRWLQRFVTSRVNHLSLQSTTVLDTLVQKMLASSDHGDGPPEDDARMQELEYEADEAATDDSPPDANNAPSAPKRAKPTVPMNAIVQIAMPEVCPAAQLVPDGKMRTVKLWYRGRRCVWLAQDDVEWAVSYMRVELDTCGVAPVDEEADEGAVDQGADAGADSQGTDNGVIPYRWDHHSDKWALTPPGRDTIFFGVQDLAVGDIPADHGASSVQAYV